MPFDIYFIDAFSDKPFGGNPAVICLLEYIDELRDDIKQKIAAEVNQPMTAFVSPNWTKNDKNNINNSSNHYNTYKIQYFTPTGEFPLCGHATVGAVLVLNERQTDNNKSIKKFTFETKFGETLVTDIDDKQQITVTLPSDGYYKTISLSDKWTQYVVSNVLGSNVDNNNVEEVVLSNKFVLIRLKDSDDNNLYKVEPNFHLLNRLDDRKDIKNGIIITQKADLQKDGIHFYSRVFLPWIGVNEDPVCGSAHTLLTPYWCQKLGLSGQQLIAKQCSQRSGIVGCRLNGNGIQLSASAVIVLKGQIFI